MVLPTKAGVMGDRFSVTPTLVGNPVSHPVS